MKAKQGSSHSSSARGRTYHARILAKNPNGATGQEGSTHESISPGDPLIMIVPTRDGAKFSGETPIIVKERDLDQRDALSLAPRLAAVHGSVATAMYGETPSLRCIGIASDYNPVPKGPAMGTVASFPLTRIGVAHSGDVEIATDLRFTDVGPRYWSPRANDKVYFVVGYVDAIERYVYKFVAMPRATKLSDFDGLRFWSATADQRVSSAHAVFLAARQPAAQRLTAIMHAAAAAAVFLDVPAAVVAANAAAVGEPAVVTRLADAAVDVMVAFVRFARLNHGHVVNAGGAIGGVVGGAAAGMNDRIVPLARSAAIATAVFNLVGYSIASEHAMLIANLRATSVAAAPIAEATRIIDQAKLAFAYANRVTDVFVHANNAAVAAVVNNVRDFAYTLQFLFAFPEDLLTAGVYVPGEPNAVPLAMQQVQDAHAAIFHSRANEARDAAMQLFVERMLLGHRAMRAMFAALRVAFPIFLQPARAHEHIDPNWHIDLIAARIDAHITAARRVMGAPRNDADQLDGLRAAQIFVDVFSRSAGRDGYLNRVQMRIMSERLADVIPRAAVVVFENLAAGVGGRLPPNTAAGSGAFRNAVNAATAGAFRGVTHLVYPTLISDTARAETLESRMGGLIGAVLGATAPANLTNARVDALRDSIMGIVFGRAALLPPVSAGGAGGMMHEIVATGAVNDKLLSFQQIGTVKTPPSAQLGAMGWIKGNRRRTLLSLAIGPVVQFSGHNDADALTYAVPPAAHAAAMYAIAAGIARVRALVGAHPPVPVVPAPAVPGGRVAVVHGDAGTSRRTVGLVPGGASHNDDSDAAPADAPRENGGDGAAPADAPDTTDAAAHIAVPSTRKRHKRRQTRDA